MGTIRRVIPRLVYQIAKRMPVSYACMGGAASIRSWCARRIMKKCGTNINIEKGATFTSSCEIGNNSGIGLNNTLYGEVIIGNNVMMGPYVIIYTKNHVFISTEVPMREQGLSEEKPVYIEDDVWIGCNVVILPGVRIRQGILSEQDR